MSWRRRVWNLVRMRAVSRELDEELEFHLEARIRDNLRAGMNREEARADATRRFGNRTLVKERARDVDIALPLETLWRDLWYGARSLRRSPGFTTAAVLILALGIGANTAVFTVVNGVLLRPLPFPEPGRLFLVSYMPRNFPFASAPSLTDRHYVEFRRRDRLFEYTASFAAQPANLTGSGEPVRVAGASVTPDFTRVLRVTPALGRTFLPEEDQPGRDRVVLLGDSIWRNRFGADPHVLGRTIILDGAPHEVIGVMPAGFAFPYGAQLWRPLGIREDAHNSMLRPAMGRLKARISARQAQAELEAMAGGMALPPDENRSEWAARVVPLKELLVGDIRKSLLVFAGAVAFVLLIACANSANLLLLRAASRRQEMAVRAALGAGRGRLIRQLLTESTLISVAGGLLGIAVAIEAAPALVALAPAGTIPRTEEIGMDGWVLAFTIGVSVLTGMAFGLVPALRATRELREPLSLGARGTTRRERLRSALVVGEIALSLVLLTGAGLMLKSFLRLRAVDPGFRPENVLTLTVDLPAAVYGSTGQMQTFHQRMLERLSRLPGVVAAGAVNWRPLGGMLVKGDFTMPGGRPLPRGYMADKLSVSPAYFRAMGIRLLSGRSFTEGDNASGAGVVMISRSVARQVWPGEDPIGERISMEEHPRAEDWLTIIGVVEDVRQRDLGQKPDAAIYQPYLQVKQPFALSRMTFAVRTSSQPRSVAPAVIRVLHEVDKNQPAESIVSMEDAIATTTAEPRFRVRLLAVFAAMAVVLSGIGIYGVLAYSVTERKREIGIRMALGAERRDVLEMVLRRTTALAGAGIALGTAGALAITRVLEKFLFEVTPTDPVTYMAVAMVLGAVALLAGLAPARRAMSVEPVVALKYE